MLTCPEKGWQRSKYRLKRRFRSLEREPALPAAQSCRQLPQPQHVDPAQLFQTQGSNKGQQSMGNQELSEGCFTSKGPWSCFSAPYHQPLYQSQHLSLCAHTISGWRGHAHCLTQAAEAALCGEVVLLQPWQLESCSAPHRLLSSWQQPLAHTWRSSVSCLTTNLTALRNGESTQ